MNRDMSSTNYAVTVEDLIDMQQWIKNIAFYTFTGTYDSPLATNNNFYMVTDGITGWGIQQYDHNDRGKARGSLAVPLTVFINPGCDHVAISSAQMTFV